MAVILNEEELNAKIRHWMHKLRDEKKTGSREMILSVSIYLDALQDIRVMHGLPRLVGL